MRYFIIACVCIAPSLAVADEFPPGFGGWAYNHGRLHESGAVDEMRKKSPKDCCRGEGECRESHVRWDANNIPSAYIDGHWCPIPSSADLRFDITKLPPDMQAMVCAGHTTQYLGERRTVCPEIFCVAIGGGV